MRGAPQNIIVYSSINILQYVLHRNNVCLFHFHAIYHEKIFAISNSKAPIAAERHTMPFKTILNPKYHILLITLKCHEKIGSNDNHPNNIQYAMNRSSINIPNAKGDTHKSPNNFKIEIILTLLPIFQVLQIICF